MRGETIVPERDNSVGEALRQLLPQHAYGLKRLAHVHGSLQSVGRDELSGRASAEGVPSSQLLIFAGKQVVHVVPQIAIRLRRRMDHIPEEEWKS